MPRKLRAFNPDFVRHFDLRGAWPKAQATGIAKSGRYSELRAGDAGIEDYFFRFVECCRRRIPDADRERRALDEYLVQIGVADPSALTVEQIVHRISRPGKRSFADALMGGIKYIVGLSELVRHPARCVRPCLNEAEVRSAIAWMFAEAGRLASRSELDVQGAIERGEQQIGISLADYRARAIEWWRAEPWTVVLALDGGRPAGMGIALPLRADVYDEVRGGRRRGHECQARDLESPSAQLLVEGLAMRHADGALAPRKPNRFLLAAVACQQAYLSRVREIGGDVPLCLLSFAGTPANRARLIRFGYQPVGTCLRGTQLELLERTLMYTPGTIEGAVYGAWNYLRRDVEAESPYASGNPLNVREKNLGPGPS